MCENQTIKFTCLNSVSVFVGLETKGACEHYWNLPNNIIIACDDRIEARQEKSPMPKTPNARPPAQNPAPMALQAQFGQGVALHQQGKLADAERIYVEVLRQQPNHFDALYLLGVIAVQARRAERGVELITKAIALKPDHADAYNNRGVALQDLKRPEEALASYDKAIALKPDHANAYYNRGIALRELKRLEDAVASYDKAIDLRPDYADAYTNRGIALRDLRRLEEAVASFDKAVALKPDYAEAYYDRGIVLSDLNRPEDALASYDKAIALKPDFAEACNSRGNALHELERFEEALASYDRALKVRPNYAEALSHRGNTLREQGRLGEAEAACRQAIALKPDFAHAYNNLGMALVNLGRLTEARRALEQAVQLMPRNSAHFLNLSNVRHFGAEDPYLAAMEELAQNIASLPIKHQIELHFALAKAYDDVGRRDESFQKLLAGNALKRRQIAYDETATLALFERIQAMFTPELMRTFQGVGEPSSVPLFIVGMPRSGTTLIEQILASHPQVFGAGELRNLEKAVVGIGPTGGPVFAFPEVLGNISGEHLRRLGTRYVSEITRLAPVATRVTDKMPLNFLYAGLIHLALPNAHIIHAVRNPVDTCMSCFSKLFTYGLYFTYDLAELGRYYRRYQALMEHWHRVLPPGRILDVRYEDVVADFEGQARRIIVHCGLEWDTRCLAFHETERPVHTASATQVRRPIYSSSIGRWRDCEPLLSPLLAELSG